MVKMTKQSKNMNATDRPIKRKLKVGDQVEVIAGRFKHAKGAVIKFTKNGRVLVEGVTATKHKKPNPQKNQEGGLVKIEVPIDYSNVAYYDAVAKKRSKIGIKFLEDGRKVRFSKASGEIIDL